MISSNTVIASTGVAMIWIRAVAYRAQANSGKRPQVMPRGRSLWIVTMKFRPVRIELKPSRKTPVATQTTAVDVCML